VLDDNYEKFLQRLIAATASLRIGPGEDPGNVIGPVIDRTAQRRIVAIIEAGRSEATLAWQGTVPENPTACFVPPTIFTDVRPPAGFFRKKFSGRY